MQTVMLNFSVKNPSPL